MTDNAAEGRLIVRDGALRQHFLAGFHFLGKDLLTLTPSRRTALVAGSLSLPGVPGNSATAADTAAVPRPSDTYAYPGNLIAESVGRQPPKGPPMPSGDLEFPVVEFMVRRTDGDDSLSRHEGRWSHASQATE